MSSESKAKERLYSCRHCGSSYTAYPPDDVKIRALANLQPKPDELQITYKCPSCKGGKIKSHGREMQDGLITNDHFLERTLYLV
jgi:rubredoxin